MPSQEEIKFDLFLKEVNEVLYYLSNVEFQKSHESNQKCRLSAPVEVVLSITDTFKFREDLEREYTNDGLRSINVVLPKAASPRKNKDSVDLIVIDDEPNEQIKITIQNTFKQEQKISVTQNNSFSLKGLKI